MTAKKSDTVSVIKKEASGWWLAQHLETEEIGWIPGSHLKQKSSDSSPNNSKTSSSVDLTGNNEYISTKKYAAKRKSEITFDRNCILEVVEKYENGWWKVKYNKNTGLAPACYLKPYIDPVQKMSQSIKIFG